MIIRSLGHAGLEVEYRGYKVQLDPWLSREGAFQASWFQWPDNSHLIDELQTPDAVVISHEHLDHVDAWWLARLPKHTPIYITRYPLGVLRRKICASGLTNIREIAPWQDVEIVPGMHLFFVPERSPMNHDTGMVLRTAQQVLVNANDATLCPLQLREISAKVGEIDVLTIQGAGASWYPMVYHYDEPQKKKLSFRKRMAKLLYVAQATRAAQPRFVIPFAGPPAFLDLELFHLNDEMENGIFPDHEQVANWMQGRGFNNVRFLYPGDKLAVSFGEVTRDPHWEGFSYSNRGRHLEEYAKRRVDQIAAVNARYPDPDGSLWPRFRDYMENLLTYNEFFDRKIGMKVGFDIPGPGGGRWAVDFRDATRGVYQDLDDISYKYTIESRWLPPILDRRLPWEDFMLSCRFRAWRDPDLYNDHLLGLLKFADREALAAVEAWHDSLSAEQTIQIRSGDRIFEVQRFCPHAGLDLLDVGEVLPGDVIRCNGHHYEFDLLSGACLNGNLDPLATTIVSGCGPTFSPAVSENACMLSANRVL